MGVTLKGIAQKISSDDLNSFSDIYLQRHPAMKPFLETSGNCLVGIRVEKLEIITDLIEVDIVEIS